MIPYASIDSVWERNKDTNKLNFGVLRRPEWSEISRWILTEKVDGTNIRVIVGMNDKGERTFEVRGRTNKAQVPQDLVQNIETQLNGALTWEALGINEAVPRTVTLYGEGYGPGIQKGGGLYRKDKGFILFDVREGNEEKGRFMDWGDVVATAHNLNIAHVPALTSITNAEIPVTREELLLYIPGSIVADEARDAEGIVARPYYELLNRYGERLHWKLTLREF